MDFKKSNYKNQSSITYPKGFKVHLVILSTLALIMSCTSKKSSPDVVDTVIFDSLEGEIHQLSRVGQNTDAHFSSMTNKLVFIRDNPKEHKTPQVYEKNMVDKTERRITFNLGENHHPEYHPYKDWIIYSSSADEIIERVDVVPTMKELGLKVPDDGPNADYPQEIYIAAEDGSDNKRITQEKGFDGLATFSKDGEKIYYVKRDSKQSQIYEFNIKSGSKKSIYTEKSKILSLSVSQDYIAWTSKVDDANEKLFVKKIKGNEMIFEGDSKYSFSDVELHSKEPRLLVAANIEDKKNTDIYQIDLNQKCATRISFHGATESNPTFGPGGTSLFYVSNRSKTNQIYATLIRPTLACKPLETESKIE
jgi:Tol biopolymer transport system component